ncbi:SoxR reducing system RseC family protein [Halomonadaceae bacterium KBTZ08]
MTLNEESVMASHEEREGEVVQCTGSRARVRVAPVTGCPRCAAGEGCGQGLLEAMRSDPRPVTFWVTVPDDERVSPGDRVMLRVTSSALVAGASLVYLVPLLGLVLGAFVGEALTGAGEGATTAAGVAGLAGGLMAARYWLRHRHHGKRFEPVFVRRVRFSDVPFT